MLPQINLNNRLSQANLSLSFDQKDLHRLFNLLQERSDAAAALEVANFKKMDQTDEQFEKNIELIREGYKLCPTIVGTNGQELFGTATEVFTSANFPESIRSVYVNSSIPLKTTHNFVTRNSFEMYLDFSRPEILDFNLLPSNRTPNASNFQVQGADATWVNGVFHEIEQFIGERRAPAPWLHRHSIYDVLVWLIGQPAAFWVCFKLSPLLPRSEGVGVFLRAALFVYIFFLVLVVFRSLFHYSRWVFPLVEYRHSQNNSLKHRVFLGALCSSLFGALIYDVLKWLALR